MLGNREESTHWDIQGDARSAYAIMKRSALAANLKIVSERNGRLIIAKTSLAKAMLRNSWGETVTISIEPLDGGASRVHVSSRGNAAVGMWSHQSIFNALRLEAASSATSDATSDVDVPSHHDALDSEAGHELRRSADDSDGLAELAGAELVRVEGAASSAGEASVGGVGGAPTEISGEMGSVAPDRPRSMNALRMDDSVKTPKSVQGYVETVSKTGGGSFWKWVLVISVFFYCVGPSEPSSKSDAASMVVGEWYQHIPGMNLHTVMKFRSDGSLEIRRAIGSGDYRLAHRTRWSIEEGRYSDSRERFFKAAYQLGSSGPKARVIVRNSSTLWDEDGNWERH